VCIREDVSHHRPWGELEQRVRALALCYEDANLKTILENLEMTHSTQVQEVVAGMSWLMAEMDAHTDN